MLVPSAEYSKFELRAEIRSLYLINEAYSHQTIGQKQRGELMKEIWLLHNNAGPQIRRTPGFMMIIIMKHSKHFEEIIICPAFT